MRYDFFIADNADNPHSGVIDTKTDRVVETFPLDSDPEGKRAELRAEEWNKADRF
jgi:hypothetical protein